MKSMTGYGEARIKVGGTELSVIIKSVNGRFLDSRFHLPKEYLQFESQFKKYMSATFRRGTVDVFIHRKKGSSDIEVRLNRDVAMKWVAAHKDLAKSLKLSFQSSSLLDRLSSLPQIFEVREESDLKHSEKSAVMALFRKALARCERERSREGASLKSGLGGILQALSQVVKKMESQRESVNGQLEVRLNERLRKLGLEGAVEPARFAQELVIYLDKCDIAEEIVRLREHILMCGKYLKASEEQGKKLDFYSQELLREVNTIGSKANYAPITELVIQAKGHIEAFKEQVQNIE